MNKKIFTFALAAALALTAAGCGNKAPDISEVTPGSGEQVVQGNPGEFREEDAIVTPLDGASNDFYSFLGIKFDTPEELQKAIDANRVYVISDGGSEITQNEDGSYTGSSFLDFGYVRFSIIPEDQRSRIPWTDSPDAITDPAEVMKWLDEETVPLGRISVFRTAYMEGKNLPDITGLENNTEIGQDGDYRFYFSTGESKAEISDETLALQKALADDMEALVQSITVSAPEVMGSSDMVTVTEEDLGNVGAFNAVDLDGNEISQEIFSEYDLTILNVWTTFCTPCIEEMPHLGELAEEMKDQGVQIIGIVNDVIDPKTGETNQELLEMARVIQERTGVGYPTLLPDAGLNEGLLKNVMAYPTTFFVNQDGNVVAGPLMGAMTKEDWEMTITEILSQLKG